VIIAGYSIKIKSSKTQKRAKKNMKELKAISKKYTRKIQNSFSILTNKKKFL
jgi:hypothetical protein